jgi:hypothetical protein
MRRKSSRVGIRPVTLADHHDALILVFEVAQDLGDAEDTDRHRNEVEPVGIADAKRERGVPV